MNVSLTPQLEEFVRRQVEAGFYDDADDVFRDALRLLIERDDARKEAGRSEPPSTIDVRPVLAALEQQLRAMGVASLALFGSVARGEAGMNSDVDVLIDIDPDAGFSLIDLVSVKLFLEERLSRDVDVAIRHGLDPAIRDGVLREAEPVF